MSTGNISTDHKNNLKGIYKHTQLCKEKQKVNKLKHRISILLTCDTLFKFQHIEKNYCLVSWHGSYYFKGVPVSPRKKI